MIRKAEFKDISGIMEVAKDAHEKSLSNSVVIDPKTLRNNLQVCILSAEHFVLVVELESLLNLQSLHLNFVFPPQIWNFLCHLLSQSMISTSRK